ADEVSHMITIKQDQVVVNTRLSWTAKAGDRLFLLSKPAILKSSSFDKDKLVWIQESESSQLLLMAKENGSYLIEYESWLPTNKHTTSFTATLPLAAGSFSKAIVQLAMEGSWQIQSSRAIVPSITAENGKSVE